ncbi:uncharacterized protein LOC133791575 [Humulus lupulus]|uniref:uncharacterized protein LOC133791575 n=1 Tax=Humulus lupulus TaxID=3486 RepID=UPI002B4144C4|nr:uncharacterized protein LOC133791575 [Humulus lupulus]
MDKAEILELFELPYSDLLLLSSDCVQSSSSSPAELQRLDLVKRHIMETLGPMGPGLLSVSGVPNSSVLRRDLPLARNLALLDSDRRIRILKENQLGSDVPLKNPGRNVSSFAMQLRYGEQNSSSRGDLVFSDRAKEFENLGGNLKELGFCMMELGLRLARVCDSAIGGRELEQSLLESRASKGRLIHYHSKLDARLLLKLNAKKKGENSKREQKKIEQAHVEQEASKACSGSDLWQQWHYDYGIFTILTAPLFLLQAIEEEDQFMEYRYKECGYPNGHTCLQIHDPNKKGIFMANSSPESFIIQVGESAEVLSKGKLRAALHSVSRPGKLENLSRETFVVFLQPAWEKVLCISGDPMKCLGLEDQCLNPLSSEEEEGIGERIEEIEKVVPPLSSRLKNGMTFAEFSRETTRQYYGGSGLQSNR